MEDNVAPSLLSLLFSSPSPQSYQPLKLTKKTYSAPLEKSLSAKFTFLQDLYFILLYARLLHILGSRYEWGENIYLSVKTWTRIEHFFVLKRIWGESRKNSTSNMFIWSKEII